MRKGTKWINRWLVLSPYYIGLCKDEENFKRELKRLKVPSPWPEWIKKGSGATAHFFENDKSKDYQKSFMGGF